MLTFSIIHGIAILIITGAGAAYALTPSQMRDFQRAQDSLSCRDAWFNCPYTGDTGEEQSND